MRKLMLIYILSSSILMVVVARKQEGPMRITQYMVCVIGGPVLLPIMTLLKLDKIRL